MKKTSRFGAVCVAGALATGLAIAPASAQDFTPSSSSQAIGDTLVNSTEPLFRLVPLVNGTPLQAPAAGVAVLSLTATSLSASMFSKQCNFVTTSNCTR